MELRIGAAPVRRVLLGLACALLALSAGAYALREGLGVDLLGLARLVGMDEEQSLPTWYSVLLLSGAAALLALCARAERERGGKDVWAWRLLCAGFAFLSVDEQGGFHEHAGRTLEALVGGAGFLRFAWVVPGLVLLPVLAAVFAGFLRRLEPRRRAQFLLAGAVYVGGAVGMEMLGGKVLSATGDQPSALYAVCFHLEESLEMVGAALFISALVEHLGALLGREGITVWAS